MDYLQEAIHTLLCEGGDDPSHFMISVGAKAITWPTLKREPFFPVNEERSECRIELEGDTITIRLSWKRPETYIGLYIRSSTSPFHKVWLDAQVFEEISTGNKIVEFKPFNDAVYDFKYLFKRLTGLDPFLFT